RWLPGNMSRPHFHPNDRFFVVISGTWWMGTGTTFDPNATVPAPAGSYVIHYGGKVHYDGAKDEETVIQVWGMGPATSTPAGKRRRRPDRRRPVVARGDGADAARGCAARARQRHRRRVARQRRVPGSRARRRALARAARRHGGQPHDRRRAARPFRLGRRLH